MREDACDRESQSGKTDTGLDEAIAKGWTAVSMKVAPKTTLPPKGDPAFKMS